MTLLTGPEYFEALTGQRTRLAAMADLERSRLLPQARPRFSFGEQMGAAFREENLFLTHVAPLFGNRPAFPDDPDFNPEAFIGAYEQYIDQFPELLQAGSLGEMSHIKNRIDGEVRDRQILEGLGFGRALAVYLPAGLLSPENFIPIGTSARVIVAALKARSTGLVGKSAAKSIGRSALRVGTEGVVTQSVAELALLQKKGLRTNEEAIFNVIGAGLISSVLGGAAGAAGRAIVAGQEVVTKVVEETNEFIAGELAKPSSKLGLALDAVADQQRGLVLEGGSDVLPRTIDDHFVGDSLTLDKEDPLRGALLEALESKNPLLAKLIGADNVIGNLITKAMFMNPSQRLGRSRNKATRLFSDSLTKTFLTSSGAKGPSLQSRIDLAEAVLIRKRALADEIWVGAEKAFKDVGIDDRAFLDLAGKAARRGGVNDDPTFSLIRDNPQLVKAVEDRAEAYRGITEVLFRTADQVGALSRSTITPGRAESLLSLLDSEYVSRVIEADVARSRMPEFVNAIEGALESRRDELLPEFVQERAALAEQIEGANPDHAKFLQGELEELDKAIAMLTDDLPNLAVSVADNYTSRARTGGGGAKPFTNSLMERVFKIDEKLIEDFLVSDVRELEARAVRSIMPDLIMADFFERSAGNQPRMAELRERLDQLTRTVNSVAEKGEATPDTARALVENLQDLADDSQAVVLGHSLRLVRDLERAEIDGIGRTMQAIDEAVEVRKRARKGMQELDRQKARLRQDIKALGDELDPDELASMKDRLAALSDARKVQRALFDGATKPVNALALRVGKQLGGTADSMGLSANELRFKDNMFKIPGAKTNEEAADQLLALARSVHGRVTGQRRFVYKLNVDPEHIEAAIRREAAKGLPGERFPGKRALLSKTTEREISDIKTKHERLRNRHGVGATSDSFTLATKRIRDFNFMTSMGSVVISSFPDVALAVSTAGMGNYLSSIARFAKNELFGTDASKRTYGQELQRALERFAIFKRHDKLHGLDDDIVLGAKGRVGRAYDGLTEKFAEFTLMDRWNAMHKMIAAQAIESRVAKTILSGNPRQRDVALLEWFGIAEEYVPMFREMLQKHSIDEGGLRLSNTEEWGNRNARLLWEAAVMKGVNDTIITPQAGAQPTFATVHPLGKMLLQFRTFSFAATNQFMLPGLQRVLAKGDPGPAFAFGMITGIGVGIYSINEVLKGRDPTEASARTLVVEGLDRGGGLGILTEAVGSTLRALNGLGIESLGTGPSRFRSRNEVDALFGPTLGKVKNAVDLAALPFRDDFSSGDASRIRRMIPFQNLWLTRLLFDGGANLASNGVQRYFDDFLKLEHRAFGFDPEEVK